MDSSKTSKFFKDQAKRIDHENADAEADVVRIGRERHTERSLILTDEMRGNQSPIIGASAEDQKDRPRMLEDPMEMIDRVVEKHVKSGKCGKSKAQRNAHRQNIRAWAADKWSEYQEAEAHYSKVVGRMGGEMQHQNAFDTDALEPWEMTSGNYGDGGQVDYEQPVTVQDPETELHSPELVQTNSVIRTASERIDMIRDYAEAGMPERIEVDDTIDAFEIAIGRNLTTAAPKRRIEKFAIYERLYRRPAPTSQTWAMS